MALVHYNENKKLIWIEVNDVRKKRECIGEEEKDGTGAILVPEEKVKRK